jgi:hypothetical protein
MEFENNESDVNLNICNFDRVFWPNNSYHIGSQQEKIPTQVWARRPGSEGGMGGAEPNRTQMWFSQGPQLTLPIKLAPYIYIYHW